MKKAIKTIVAAWAIVEIMLVLLKVNGSIEFSWGWVVVCGVGVSIVLLVGLLIALFRISEEECPVEEFERW